MIKRILKISILFVLIGSWSCKDYLDINHDPNVLEEIPSPEVLLPSAQVNLANTLMGWDLGIAGAFWSQYWTQEHNHSQFKSICSYSPASFGNSYNNLTSGVLYDLKKIQRMANENNQPGLVFISEALEIYTWQILTDVWGDVPYFEAMKRDEGISEPKYDSGEAIYKDLHSRINNLISTIASLPTQEEINFEKRYDFIFEGDINKWASFAKSLKLKLMIRLSETPGYDNAAVLNYIAEEKDNFLKENAKISHKIWDNKKEGKRHPMMEAQLGGANYLSSNVIACATFYEYLYNNGDIRLKSIFNKSKNGGAFFGDYSSLVDTDGDGEIDKEQAYSSPIFAQQEENVDKMNKNLLDIVLISNWELAFYEAEVYKRAGDDASAEDYYKKGVEASVAIYDTTKVDWAATYCKWDPATGLEQIAMQKWVAYANFQHYESFLERNRLKIPKVWNRDIKINRQSAYDDYAGFIGCFTISVEGRGTLGGKLPSAAVYPDFILARNTNAPAQKANLATKIWWDTKPENIVE